MGVLWCVLGVVLIAMSAWEAFEAIVLPRTVSRKIRFTALFYYLLWRVMQVVAGRLSRRPVLRESFLSVIGPLALIMLIACWTVGIILGFALIHFGLETPLTNGESGLVTNLYMSAATFFTLGYGDVVPREGLGRFISMIEAGMGFGGLALVIGYMPVLYQSFSARERVSLLLDARAGSPPVAAELLRFYGDDIEGLESIFHEFEHWGATLLESYLSFPILSSYRSQHEQLSWLASTTCLCDACVFVIAGYKDDSVELRGLHRQATLTYAMLRHLTVDLAYILDTGPVDPPAQRLDADAYRELVKLLEGAKAPLRQEDVCCDRLEEMRSKYEPYLYGLSQDLFMKMPGWLPEGHAPASWETTAWDEAKHF